MGLLLLSGFIWTVSGLDALWRPIGSTSTATGCDASLFGVTPSSFGIFGGHFGASGYSNSSSLFSFDIEHFNSSFVDENPYLGPGLVTSGSASAILPNGSTILFSGADLQFEPTSQLLRIDLDGTITELTSMSPVQPAPRFGSRSVANETQFVIVGGWLMNSGIDSNDIWSLDLETLMWTERSPSLATCAVGQPIICADRTTATALLGSSGNLLQSVADFGNQQFRPDESDAQLSDLSALLASLSDAVDAVRLGLTPSQTTNDDATCCDPLSPIVVPPFIEGHSLIQINSSAG